MNTKMKKVNITLEIPENMEVSFVMKGKSDKEMIVSLRESPPRTLKFREIVGRDYINPGEYYTDIAHIKPLLWATPKFYFHHKYDDNVVIWEMVQDEC